jgi:hypothetical protein
MPCSPDLPFNLDLEGQNAGSRGEGSGDRNEVQQLGIYDKQEAESYSGEKRWTRCFIVLQTIVYLLRLTSEYR